MRKGRVSNTARKTRRQNVNAVAPTKPTSKSVKFIGISLSGGKADKTCLVIMEYFPEAKKLFLSHVMDKIKAEEFISADLKVFEIVTQHSDNLAFVAFDSPLSLPKCLRCSLPCPGYEVCTEPEIKWMRDQYMADTDKKKPRKYFTPYTQRCVDQWLAANEDENLGVQQALGANLAPVTTRAIFIRRRITAPAIEVFTKFSVWRVGLGFKVNKSALRSYRNSVGGEDSRRVILQQFSEKAGIFFYQQDLRILTENFHAFDALVAAYTAFLKYQGKTQPRPVNFPKDEAWVEIPS